MTVRWDSRKGKVMTASDELEKDFLRNGLLKVINGTPRSDKESLCLSCSQSHITKYDDGRTVTLCDSTHSLSGPIIITGKVVECNRYRKKNEPTLGDLEEIALKVDPNNKRVRNEGFSGGAPTPDAKDSK